MSVRCPEVWDVVAVCFTEATPELQSSVDNVGTTDNDLFLGRADNYIICEQGKDFQPKFRRRVV